MDLYDDWRSWYALKAAMQGWMLYETGFSFHSALEVRCLDRESWTELGMQLPSDDKAVDAFREAFINGHDHAVLAYNIIKQHSPSEYHYWKMADWRCSATDSIALHA